MIKSKLDFWRLIDELSVLDAAILITGNDPSEKEQMFDMSDNTPIFNSDGSFQYRQRTDYDNFEPTFKALRNAILSNRLKASLSYSSRDPIIRDFGEPYSDHHSYGSHTAYDADGAFEVSFDTLIRTKDFDGKIFTNRELNLFGSATKLYVLKEPNWQESNVDVEDLKKWLKSRGFFPDFFFPQGGASGFKDKNHSRYSPKLACAIAAWESVQKAQPNKSVKESIALWVQSNGVNFGMTNADGVVPAKAIEQVATVANWDTKGGATRTYTNAADEEGEEANEKTENFNAVYDFDNDIPF